MSVERKLKAQSLQGAQTGIRLSRLTLDRPIWWASCISILIGNIPLPICCTRRTIRKPEWYGQFNRKWTICSEMLRNLNQF